MLESVTILGMDDRVIAAAESLAPAERAAAGAAATLVVSMVFLGVLQGYGTRTVAKCRRSPVISACIGLPGILVLGLVTAVSYLMLATTIGVFFGVPLVGIAAIVIPSVTAIGFVAIGQSIAARFGHDRLWAGVVVGSLVAGVASASIPVAIVVGSIAAAFGTGASVRVLVGSRGAASPDERTVPPANQI